LETLKGRNHFGDIGIDGRIILKWMLKNWVCGCELDPCDSGWGLVASSCDHGSEPSGSVKGGEFLD
jgi:hypothetical protein